MRGEGDVEERALVSTKTERVLSRRGTMSWVEMMGGRCDEVDVRLVSGLLSGKRSQVVGCQAERVLAAKGFTEDRMTQFGQPCQ